MKASIKLSCTTESFWHILSESVKEEIKNATGTKPTKIIKGYTYSTMSKDKKMLKVQIEEYEENKKYSSLVNKNNYSVRIKYELKKIDDYKVLVTMSQNIIPERSLPIHQIINTRLEMKRMMVKMGVAARQWEEENNKAK